MLLNHAVVVSQIANRSALGCCSLVAAAAFFSAGCSSEPDPVLGREHASATALSVSVVSASNGSPISGLDPLTSGDVIDLSSVPTPDLSIVAKADSVGSIEFVLDGSYVHVENIVPYSLCGDATSSFTPCSALSAIGTHRLQVTPYSGSQASGTPGSTLDLSFDVVAANNAQVPPASGISFTLVNADNGSAISGFNPMVAGAVLKLPSLPANLSIRADAPSSVASVMFAVDSSFTHGETMTPFSLCGDQTTTYSPCSVLAAAGTHELTLTPYSQPSQGGTAGTPVSLSFTVQSGTSQTAPAVTSQPQAVTVSAGQSATFSVAASGSTPLAYQWRKNGSAIAGATGTVYVTPATTTADNGATFSVTVSNSMGSATSSGARLTVNSPPTAPPPMALPLKMKAGAHYLVDQNDRPVMLFGDSPWDFPMNLSTSDAIVYLDDRKKKGFNALLTYLIDSKFATNAPADLYGNQPFTTRGDFSTPNDAYFAHIDEVVRAAEQRNMILLLAPAYLGYGGGDEGFYQQMVANGTTKLQAYGEYVGNRYKGFTNILWVDGGDYIPPDRSVVRAVAGGIKSRAPGQLHTVHTSRNNEAMAVWTNESWLDVDNVYTGASVYPLALSAYGRSGFRPFFLIESYYENATGTTAASVRQEAYEAVMNGAMGQVFGSTPLWFFPSNWKDQLNTVGSFDMSRLAALFAQLQWNKLVPDVSHAFLTSGYGADGADHADATLASDGTLALVYAPSVRTLTINMSKFSGSVSARWYDPTNGQYVAISGSPFSNSGTRSFTPSGRNSAGDADWVLVLTAP